MENRTLVLTAAYQPHKVVSLSKAVSMLFLGKLDVVQEYEEVIGTIPENRLRDFTGLARSYKRFAGDGLGDLVLRIPSVVTLTRSFGGVKRIVKFTRENVYTRDNFTCQYCGVKKKANELNRDHVMPRSRGGKTTWENIVTTCYPCNEKKGARTPEQASMKLRKAPYKPKSLPTVPPRFDPRGIPAEWLVYVTSSLGEEILKEADITAALDTNRPRSRNNLIGADSYPSIEF